MLLTEIQTADVLVVVVSGEMTGRQMVQASAPREQVPRQPRRRPLPPIVSPCIFGVLLGAAQPSGLTTTLSLSYAVHQKLTTTHSNVVGQVRRQGDGRQRDWLPGPRP